MTRFFVTMTANLKPRTFQLDCFELAKQQNVIAVLDTGSGKTFISVMLAKHVALEDFTPGATDKNDTMVDKLMQDRPKRKLMFFLVNSVPLVFQQATVLRQQTALRVGHYCGEMQVDLWGEEQWKYLFEQLDIIVMTAQILLDLLAHGFISMSDISLLIFDECHHARKRHPFNVILQEFYHILPKDGAERPRIFGMTASPLNRKESCDASIRQLQANLDAVIYTVTRDECRELEEAAPKPQEHVVYFDPPASVSTVNAVVIEEAVSSYGAYLTAFIKSIDDASKELVRARNRLQILVSELGTYPVEQFLYESIHGISDMVLLSGNEEVSYIER